MAKWPLDWHKNNLKNMRDHVQRRRDEGHRILADAAATERRCIELDAQIIRAELKGIKEFDPDKFNKKRTDAASSPSKPEGK